MYKILVSHGRRERRKVPQIIISELKTFEQARIKAGKLAFNYSRDLFIEFRDDKSFGGHVYFAFRNKRSTTEKLRSKIYIIET